MHMHKTLHTYIHTRPPHQLFAGRRAVTFYKNGIWTYFKWHATRSLPLPPLSHTHTHILVGSLFLVGTVGEGETRGVQSVTCLQWQLCYCRTSPGWNNLWNCGETKSKILIFSLTYWILLFINLNSFGEFCEFWRHHLSKCLPSVQ